MTYFVGLTEFFDRYPLKILKGAAGVISFDAVLEPVKALRHAVFVLGKKHPVCLFPEGGRSADGRLMELKKGIAVLAETTGVPVCPVRIEGAFESWPVDRKFPRLFREISVTIGAPVIFSSTETFMNLLAEGISAKPKRVEK